MSSEEYVEPDARQRQEILEMVASGKIDIDEATRLLSGAKVEQSDPQEKPEITEKAPEENALIPEFEDGGRPRWFHVHVTDAETGKSKVRVNIPLRLVQFGLAVGKRFSPELQEFDIDELSSYMSSEKGLLVDVEDNEDGERVLIYVD